MISNSVSNRVGVTLNPLNFNSKLTFRECHVYFAKNVCVFVNMQTKDSPGDTIDRLRTIRPDNDIKVPV